MADGQHNALNCESAAPSSGEVKAQYTPRPGRAIRPPRYRSYAVVPMVSSVVAAQLPKPSALASCQSATR
jgi:hypothetical protein